MRDNHCFQIVLLIFFNFILDEYDSWKGKKDKQKWRARLTAHFETINDDFSCFSGVDFDFYSNKEFFRREKKNAFN